MTEEGEVTTRAFTKAEKIELVDKYNQGELSVNAFAEANKLSSSMLNAWVKIYGSKAEKQDVGEVVIPAKIVKIFNKFVDSRLTQVEFAKSQKIKPSLLYHWLVTYDSDKAFRKLRRENLLKRRSEEEQRIFLEYRKSGLDQASFAESNQISKSLLRIVVQKNKKDLQRKYSRSEAMKLIHEYFNSGMNQKEFSKFKGIKWRTIQHLLARHDPEKKFRLDRFKLDKSK